MEPVKQVEPAKKPALSVERLTVFFAATGGIAGIISGIATSINITLNFPFSLLIAIILFYVSYKLTAHEKIKNKFLMTPVEESKVGKKPNIIMTGFPPYFIIWLIVWVLVYTLLINPG